MNLQEALKAIPSVKGQTTMIGSVMSGDFSHLSPQDGTKATMIEASQNLEKHEDLLKNCKSDYAYWGHLGDVVYWKAVIKVLEAAEITGPDDLPDVEAPNPNGVVMDIYGRIENYGCTVFELANKPPETPHEV